MEEFKDKTKIYYGHGTNIGGEKIIKTIFENGLRCSHQSLYYTTICLGYGSETLYKDNKKMLDNWKHKNAKDIVIISIPDDYLILRTIVDNNDTLPYCKYVSEKQALQENYFASGYYLKPEFIRGYYSADNGTFISNPKYYENLPEEQQQKILEVTRNNYLHIIDSYVGLEDYQKIVAELPFFHELSDSLIQLYRSSPEKFPIDENIIKEFINEECIM